MLELYQKPLSEIPIKRISLAEQKPFVELVDRILEAKRGDHQGDTTNLERQVDQLVYELYDLTDDEIAVVEGSTRR